MRHRQHRQPGAGVLLCAIERERPEMRRRPGEDDEEQQQRFRRDLPGHRRPAEHRRHRTGSPADHDVLRRKRLEDHRVEDGVAHERPERQPHRERVHELVEQPQPGAADHAGEDQRLQRRQLSARQRPGPGAGHHGVDLLLDEAVDRGRGAGDERDAGGRREQEIERDPAPRGHREEHADHGAEHDQRNNARLGQLEKLAQAVRGDVKRGGGHRERAGTAGEASRKFITSNSPYAAAAMAQPVLEYFRSRRRSPIIRFGSASFGNRSIRFPRGSIR